MVPEARGAEQSAGIVCRFQIAFIINKRTEKKNSMAGKINMSKMVQSKIAKKQERVIRQWGAARSQGVFPAAICISRMKAAAISIRCFIITAGCFCWMERENTGMRTKEEFLFSKAVLCREFPGGATQRL